MSGELFMILVLVLTIRSFIAWLNMLAVERGDLHFNVALDVNKFKCRIAHSGK